MIWAALLAAEMAEAMPWSNAVVVLAFIALIAWAIHCFTRNDS